MNRRIDHLGNQAKFKNRDDLSDERGSWSSPSGALLAMPLRLRISEGKTLFHKVLAQILLVRSLGQHPITKKNNVGDFLMKDMTLLGPRAFGIGHGRTIFFHCASGCKRDNRTVAT